MIRQRASYYCLILPAETNLYPTSRIWNEEVREALVRKAEELPVMKREGRAEERNPKVIALQ